MIPLNSNQLLCFALSTGCFLATVPASHFVELDKKRTEFLSTKEWNYYSKLNSERRKVSYLTGRFAAKRALSAYLNEKDLRTIDIDWGVFQQPIIRYPSDKLPGVSIAHTDHLAAALVFPLPSPMGIDLEKVDSNRIEAMHRVMTPQEIKLVASNKIEEVLATTVIWTAKEGLSKAILLGLTFPFNLFEIKEWETRGKETFGSFQHFNQYRFLSRLLSDQTVLTIVFPKKFNFSLNGEK